MVNQDHKDLRVNKDNKVTAENKVDQVNQVPQEIMGRLAQLDDLAQQVLLALLEKQVNKDSLDYVEIMVYQVQMEVQEDLAPMDKQELMDNLEDKDLQDLRVNQDQMGNQVQEENQANEVRMDNQEDQAMQVLGDQLEHQDPLDKLVLLVTKVNEETRAEKVTPDKTDREVNQVGQDNKDNRVHKDNLALLDSKGRLVRLEKMDALVPEVIDSAKSLKFLMQNISRTIK